MNSDNDKSLASSTISNRKNKMFILGDDDSLSDNERVLEKSAVQAVQKAIDQLVNPPSNEPILGVQGDTYFDPPIPFQNELGMFNIRRPIYSQSRFNKRFGENLFERKSHRFFDSVFVPMRKKKNCLEFIFSIFPILTMLKKYNFKSNFPLDLLSGITTGVMRIPQSMAYAILANMSPVFGLYTAFFSALIYPIFGGSHHMAAGAQGVVSLLIGGGVTKAIKGINLYPCNVTKYPAMTNSNNSFPSCEQIFEDTEIDIALTITFMAGLFQCLFGICRFGFVTNYLSDALIGGYTTAAVCSVVVSQLPKMFGIKTHSYTGTLNIWYLIIEFFSKLPRTNLASFTISIICLIFLASSKYASSKLIRRIKIPIPGELLVMIGSILFSSFSGTQPLWHFQIVGEITPGLLKPRLPDPKYMLQTIEASFPAAIVSFAIGYSISKRMALQHDYDINGNQEIFAFGVMNSVGSFFNCFAATASMSATLLHESIGGVSQIANLIASFLLLLAILFIGPLFKSMPECVLSTIILINLKGILWQFGDLKILWKVSKIDFLLWLVTFLAVIILDVDIGLGLGILFSLLTIVFRTQWPYVCLLGRIPRTDIYKNINLTRDAQEVTGIKIFRFEGSLYFASAEHFRNSIQEETCLNATKIINSKKEREQKLLKVKQLLSHNRRNQKGSKRKLIENSIIDLNCKEIHHIIIDFSTCSFIDSVGVRTLMQVIHDYNMADISVFLANVRAAVLAMLKNCSDLYKTVNAHHIFLSVHDAVLAALEDAQNTNEKNYIIKEVHIKSAQRYVSRTVSDPEISQSFKSDFSETP